MTRAPSRSTSRNESTVAGPSSSSTPARSRRPRSRGHRPGDLRHVRLGHLVRRVGQPVRQLPVVGQEDQPLGVRVQPADVEEPLVAGPDVVPQVGPPPRVGHGAEDPQRLVERQVHVPAAGRPIRSPSTRMTAVAGSTRTPISRTIAPSTSTRPAAISSSHARRLADAGRGEHLLQPDPLRASSVGHQFNLRVRLNRYPSSRCPEDRRQRGQFVQRAQPEPLQEVAGRPVEERSALRVRPALLDQAPRAPASG